MDIGEPRTCADGSDCVEVGVEAPGTGTYAVEWRVLSADGHPISGAYSFSVGAPSTGGVRRFRPASASALFWEGLGRFLHLCATATLLGLPAFGALVLGGSIVPAWRPRLWRGIRLGFALFLVAAVLLLAGQSLALAGDLRPASLAELLATHWGTLWWGRLAIAVLLLFAARAASRGATWGPHATLVLGAGLGWLTSLNGHAAATDPVWFSVAVDFLHLLATALWIGGLFALAFLLLPALREGPDGERTPTLARVVPRFSRLALVCVPVLLLTGVYPTLAHVESPAALIAEPYGRALLAKWSLVVLLLIPAAGNLLVVRPRLASAAAQKRDDRVTARLFGRLLSLEVGLAVLVLFAVGFLTALPPARTRAASARPPAEPSAPVLTMVENAGSTRVTLRVEESDGPALRLGVTLEDESGGVSPVSEVRLRAMPPPGSSEPVVSSRMAAEGGRHWCVQRLGAPGTWTLEVSFQTAGADGRKATFSLPMPLDPPGPGPSPQ
jgi:copper transport protein